ncbi:MerR family transcriptional regulator [Saccharopolyspora elongata]|uniref:MerR family transcriptional regulator n=1 Tax=Saccharopolyspora elongata TaxID=2530387 RepID=A0A4R4YRR3_9PSEU|nr:MerR family transcriptional regulator [Saccharopolyspora elongata]TDD47921.1 MerR family transcriptional regulator [Saccharopolyspora elongata]
MTGTGGEKQPLWSVGALARATGLTVRTLHHYDELGLLQAGERTRSGHRRYTEHDLQRLYQIRLLRQLGMSLEEIGDVLADPAALREVLVAHLDQLDEQASRLDALRSRTRNLLEQLDGSWRPESGEFLTALGRMTTIDQYITDEQQAVLDERADALGAEGRKLLDAEWPLVAAKLVRHCEADDPVDDPGVQRATRRLFELGDLFTGGDPAILQTMLRFLRERAVPDDRGFVFGEDFLDYLDRACAVMRKN